MMDRSNIVDKSTIEQAVNQALSQAVKKITTWTRKELSNSLAQAKATGKTPIIMAFTNNCYLVGDYAIRQCQDQWSMIYRYNDRELVFDSRTSAIFYAVCEQIGRIDLSDQILTYDQEVSRLRIDHSIYHTRLQRSKNSNADLYRTRYLQTSAQLATAIQRLEKTLRMAKYINL